MLKTHAVGIDLGTTYSCLSYLNEHGEPVTLPNQEGELSTPSVVMFDGGEVIVGTEALRNAVLKPSHVVQNAKRDIGSNKTWQIDRKTYTPVDIGAFVLKKMLSAAEEQIGEIKQAVITVPAQFSDWQRQATVEAGHQAGLKTVDIINEPVAAALCYVLGTEGLWFTELADEQRILVYDLGGGTFDLSLVKYHKDEVKVVASTGDLHLGGIDWNDALQQAICDRFAREFGSDPRQDPESMQLLAMAVENTKRGLTVRPRAALTCSHGGHRKVYQVEQAEFEKLTKSLLNRSISLTREVQKAYSFGLKPSHIILTTGGSSRMPMIKRALGEIGFRTPNTSLSPDQSISHGATYYAGMLLTNTEFAKSILSAKATARLAKIKQRSVNARALGILVRDAERQTRVPHYLIPANTELPTSITQTFGTVNPNQKRVHLHIIESGTIADQQFVELGTCI
ncbi:MAG TPA: Hsp70 family protein, partial [Planctomycetaceae bacterium]|nr:Hsp70 family protein [Planctomycetaceae bacterium]